MSDKITASPTYIETNTTYNVFFVIASKPDGAHCYSSCVVLPKGYTFVPNEASQTKMAQVGVTLVQNSGIMRIYVGSSNALAGSSFNIVGTFTRS